MSHASRPSRQNEPLSRGKRWALFEVLPHQSAPNSSPIFAIARWRLAPCQQGMVRSSVRWPVSRVLCLHMREAMAIPLGRALLRASRDPPGRRSGNRSTAIPIRSCSRWGLPCRLCCQRRGALLPHHFNLAAARAGRRCDFCGAVPQVALGGRYPSPCFRGARTFLDTSVAGCPAAIRPSDSRRYIE